MHVPENWRDFFRDVLFAGLWLALGLFSFADSHAQGSKYGRTSASGNWADSNWIHESGSTFSSPASGDDVFIGDATTIAGATEPATLDVSDSHLIWEVSLGNTAVGNLNLLSGGSLTMTQDLTVLKNRLAMGSASASLNRLIGELSRSIISLWKAARAISTMARIRSCRP